MSSNQRDNQPVPPPELPPPRQGEPPIPWTDAAAFLSTPFRMLHSTQDAALMSGVDRRANRTADPRRRSPLLPVQTYTMQNNSAFIDRGENTVFVHLSDGAGTTARPVFKTKLVRDGSILGYDIMDAETGAKLLKVHFHGDTTSALQRTFKAFFRSPVLKWDVENFGLFSDLPHGHNLGLIRDVFPDHRVFEPAANTAIPRLEMQVAASLGTRYLLAVTDVPEPVGQVDSALVGRFAYRSESYTMALRRCTREEAVLWLCMVIATDMKRRKVQTWQAGRTPIYGPNLFDPF